MMTSSIVRIRYSSGLSPAFRTTSFASFRCLPLQQDRYRSGDETSMYFVNDRSWTLTFPAPAPPPMWALPDWFMPQLHDRTSISSLCLSSPDSPLIPSILMNMSTAMDHLLLHSRHVPRQ